MTLQYINHPQIWSLYMTPCHKTWSILTDWFRGNKLSLNVSKTNYMIFSTSNLDIDQLTIKMDNQTINRTNCTKFLGLFIDDKMKWETHINNMKSRISRSRYAINKIKHFTPSKILKTLYYSVVYPYLTYGTRQSEMANTSPRHMPVLGNVHPIKIENFDIFFVTSFHCSLEFLYY